MSAKFSNWSTAITGGSVAASISLTTAIFVRDTGVVEVAGESTGMINMGTIQAGTLLEIGVKQVGTHTTANIIPLR